MSQRHRPCAAIEKISADSSAYVPEYSIFISLADRCTTAPASPDCRFGPAIVPAGYRMLRWRRGRFPDQDKLANLRENSRKEKTIDLNPDAKGGINCKQALARALHRLASLCYQDSVRLRINSGSPGARPSACSAGPRQLCRPGRQIRVLQRRCTSKR